MNGDAAQFAQAPHPYFGGKSRIAGDVWARLGDPANTVDPFFGSNAFLLARPHWDWARGDWQDGQRRTETVNDLDGMVCNFYRALKHDPEATAAWADDPIHECDLHARHAWLVERKADLVARLEGDPDFYDAKVAGWWVWGLCAWIGSGWCSGQGPWHVEEGRLVRREQGAGEGVTRKLPHLGNAGVGINRQRPALGDDRGVHRKLPHLYNGRGVHRQLPNLRNAGMGINSAQPRRDGLLAWFAALSARLRDVRVCCGDWQRVLGPTPTVLHGLTAVFLDPPYDQRERDPGVYVEDAPGISAAVRAWAIVHGEDPMLRIALCDYGEAEHEFPAGWQVLRWEAHGGYGSQGDGRGRENKSRECIWFSPTCLQPQVLQPGLWD